MLWDLLGKGTLPPWEFAVFVLLVLILAAGPVAIRMLWPWGRREAAEDPGGPAGL